MSLYTKISMRLFGKLIDPYLSYFSDLKIDIKRAGMKISLEEYLSIAITTSFFIFVFELPLLALVFTLLKPESWIFGFVTAITFSIITPMGFFILFINYPRILIRDRTRNIDNALPFATTYISSIAGSKLPPHEILRISSMFTEYGEVTEEIKNIVADIKGFGFDVNTALERAANRTPSKNLREVFWGMVSTIRAGGELDVYLREKAKTLLNDYRRRLNEFSHSLSVYIEIYLTALILGAIFFTILTSIMAGMIGGRLNLLLIQFFIIFIIMPLISTAFIILIKASSPSFE